MNESLILKKLNHAPILHVFIFFFYFLILLNKVMISINSKKIENPQKIVEREKNITLN